MLAATFVLQSKHVQPYIYVYRLFSKTFPTLLQNHLCSKKNPSEERKTVNCRGIYCYGMGGGGYHAIILLFSPPRTVRPLGRVALSLTQKVDLQ